MFFCPSGVMGILATAKTVREHYKGWGSSFGKLKAKRPTCRTDPNCKLRVESKSICVIFPTSLFRQSCCLL